VIGRLVEIWQGNRVSFLWSHIFNDLPAPTSTEDLFIDFANRVNDQLFEIDLDYMGELYYAANENPFDYPIYLYGYRLPWEVASIEELEPYQQPLAAWLSSWEHDDPVDVWRYFETYRLDALAVQLVPPEKTALRRSLVARLGGQPEPFNALADLLAAAWDLDVQSIFLTCSNLAGEEYAPADLFYWTLEDIHYLTGQYNLARPAIHRIRAYTDWFDAALQEHDPACCPHQATFGVLQEAFNAG